MPKIRLQKYCSEQGIASRRKAEEYIQKGWVKVNGQVVTELGIKIDPTKDKVELTPEAKQEIEKLLIHGLLHLVGYDHITDKEALEMEGIEKSLLL